MYDLISFLTRSSLKWFANLDLIGLITIAMVAALMGLLVLKR